MGTSHKTNQTVGTKCLGNSAKSTIQISNHNESYQFWGHTTDLQIAGPETWEPITRPPRALGPVPFPCTLQSPFHQNAYVHEHTLDHEHATHPTLSHSRSSSVNHRCSFKRVSDKQASKPRSEHQSGPERPPSPPSTPVFSAPS